jgi:osmoprotectant transport system permease protein
MCARSLTILCLLLLLGAAVPASQSVPAPAPAPAAVRVGSKAFTESVVLGEMATQLATAAGARATHERSLGGTRLVWDALRSGEIDLYPEYTGTLVTEIFARRRVDSAAALRDVLGESGIEMTRPLGFNNTYALGMRDDVARRLGITRLSELRDHPGLRIAFSNEFMDRADGWPAVRQRYRLPQQAVRGMDHDLAYRALAGGAIDVTDLYSTDAEIEQAHLRVLDDDLKVFPQYNAVYLYRAELARRAPAVVAAIRRLEGRITAGDMTRLNARAKLDHIPESQVAQDFLAQTVGLRTASPPADSVPRRILATTRQHLFLVGVSLAAAVAVAVPLGVVAAKCPRAGQVILAITAGIYTVPSLALLVFMIPVLGIGAWPAVVALFLYSLLPVVRNTQSGLASIPRPLRESAEVLGLPASAVLLRVELPMASPAILAGIKTAAVLNVGTATLGALIGAGGYGQPILTGIRLDDVSLLLQGALPAAAMALLAQGGFELLERRIVPRGLRAKAGPG